jgi:ribonuclease Z
MSPGRALLLAVVLAAALAGGSAAAEPDALKITFCGTSGPLPVKDRAKPCVAIEAGGELYLVDIGPEATENLMSWRLPIARARAVFLTHLHSDHIGEVGEFNLQSWVAGRPQPLLLVGPPGVATVARGFNLAYEPDHAFRHAHHDHGEVRLPIAAGRLSPRTVVTGAPDAQGVREAVAWRENGLVVMAIAVNHDPATPAYAYRFDYRGRSVVVSGDTRKWPPLAEGARGTDVLIHEAQNAAMTRLVAGALAAQGQARMASIMTDTLSYHTTPVEAAEIAKAAHARRLVLTHLTQAGLPIFNPAAFTAGMSEVNGPDWRLAKDGMTILLPVGDDEIVFGTAPGG